MNPLNTIILFATAWLAVFLAAAWDGPRAWLGTSVDLLPALMVYAGLTCSLGIITGLAVFGGLLFDSLSANPLGITFIPLFLTGWLVRENRELILRDQVYAQFVLGAMAGAAVPLGCVLLLLGGGHRPLLGWGSAWQWLVLALASGSFTPVCFKLFDRIQRLFSYQPLPESSFRPDREIKRGRA